MEEEKAWSLYLINREIYMYGVSSVGGSGEAEIEAVGLGKWV